MLFNSFSYLIFLPVVVGLYWLSPKVLRPWLLLLASYIFYMHWIPSYGFLIAGLTVVNYFVGLAIHHFTKHRRLALTLGLIFNLSCLCFFKYANFVIDSLWHAGTGVLQIAAPAAQGFATVMKEYGFGAHGFRTYEFAVHGFRTHVIRVHGNGWYEIAPTLNLPATEPVLNILLPLGISFFAFEFIHYIVDVYRGSAPIKNFLHFGLFGAFFPSQIAGPIKRFQDFMKQVVNQPIFSRADFGSGLGLIFLGLFKKTVLADNIAQFVVAGFAHPESLGTLDAWLVVSGFTLQLYFDFSGYTDIGRGSALLLGYRVPENFNWPFLAASLTEFWHRWHMSLSTWLRDYLFIPLGGSRVTPGRLRVNLLITMILGGLWHGAAWHYVIWGAFHGVGLVICRTWQEITTRVPVLNRLRPHPLWHWSGWLCTMLFLIPAGLLFRADGIPQALQMASRMFSLQPPGDLVSTMLTSTVPAALTAYSIFLIVGAAVKNTEALPVQPYWYDALSKTRSWWQGSLPAHAVAYVALGVLILGFAPGKVTPFIYFQF